MFDFLEIQINEQADGVSADALRSVLDQTLKFLATGGGGDWKITQISMNSPLTLRLDWRPAVGGGSRPMGEPSETLVRSFAMLRRGEMPGEEIDVSQTRSLAKLAAVARVGRTMTVRAGRGEPVAVDAEWSKLLNAAATQRVKGRRCPISRILRLAGWKGWMFMGRSPSSTSTTR